MRKITVYCLGCAAFGFAHLSCEHVSAPHEPDSNFITRPQQTIPWPGLADSPWPMFLHDPQHTGRSSLKGPDSGKVIWSVDLGGEIFSSPAIGPDGTIYVGAGAPSNTFFAINPNGTTKWQFQANDKVDSSPLIAADGTIYVGSDDGYLYAFAPNGNLKWKFDTDGAFGLSSPNISKDGEFIFVQVTRRRAGGGRGFLYALNMDGSEKWRFSPDAEEFDYFAPALSPDGKTIYAAAVGALYAVDSSGRLKWKYQLNKDRRGGPPSVDSDGNVYMKTGEKAYSFSSMGKLRWSYSTYLINIKYSAISIGWDGTLFIENEDELDAMIYAGKLKWRFQFTEVLNVVGSDATPIIDVRGDSYLGLIPGGLGTANLLALNKDGRLKFAAQLKHPGRTYLPCIDSFPAIGNNDVLYSGSDGDLYFFAVK